MAEAQSFVGRYGPTRTPVYAELQEDLRQTRMLEEITRGLSNAITLPKQLTLTTAECGTPNAYYNQDRYTIVLCLELVTYLTRGMLQDFGPASDKDSLKKTVVGAFLFVMMHEVGHALIHVLELPVLGREEDAADQIAAFFVLDSPDAEFALRGALWFFRAKTSVYTQRHFSDEHSLGPQRQSNLACWAFGKDRLRYQYAAKALLSQERAVRCSQEYKNLQSAVHQLLGKNVNLPAR